MKLGTENKNKTIAALVLLAIAVLLVIRMLVTDGGQPAPAPAPSQAQAPSAPAGNRSRRGRNPSKTELAPATASLDPRLQLGLLKQAESTQYTGAGRDIFRAEAAPIPQPVTPVITHKNTQPAPPPPPPVNPGPPPINLKFFGFANRPGEPREAFLAQGDDVFIAREGDVVKGRYKVLHITSNSVELQDVLTNNPPQTIPLTQG